MDEEDLKILLMILTALGVGGIFQALTENWLAALSAAWTTLCVVCIYFIAIRDR